MNKASLTGLVCGVWVSFNLAPATADSLVNFPTGPAAWTVEITPSQTANNPAAEAPAAAAQTSVTALKVTQDSEKRYTVATWSNGQTTGRWEIFRFNLLLLEDPLGQAFSVDAGGSQAWPFAIPFVPSAFAWLDPTLLQGKDPVDYQGEKCFHYKGKVLASIVSGDGRDDKAFVAAEAWIDSKTLLPVALDDGTSLGSFKFQKTPPPPLTLPTKYQIVYAQYKGAKGILNPVVLPAH